MIRKLTNLTREKYGKDAGKLNIHFAYYEEIEGDEKWNHTWDECTITEDELYKTLKPLLIRKETSYDNSR